MRKALIVGINNYPISPLSGCVNDALAIKRVLERHADNSKNFDVKLLTCNSGEVTRATLKAAIEQLFHGDSEIALLYFSGHGSINSTGGYLVTTDAKRYDEGVSMDQILSLANNSKAKDKIIFLDCCHSGALGTPNVGGGNVAQLAEGVSVLTASRDSESAIETNGFGVFTDLVAHALEGGAADLLGRVTPGSIYAYVDSALGPWGQRPVFKTNVTRFTSLRTTPAPVRLSVLHNLIEYFPNQQDEHKMDPAYEDTAPSHDPKKAAIMKELQKLVAVGLVKPVGEEHMYFAAMNSKSCRLTPLGFHYWRLAKAKLI